MENTLNIQLSLDTLCQLYAINDYKSITRILDYAIVEILTDFENKTLIQRVHEIKSENDTWLTKSDGLKLIKDGTHNYYQMLIPKFSYYLSDGQYLVKNKYFVYENEVFISDSDLSKFDSTHATLVEDYTKAWDDKDSNSQIFWFHDEFLSICKLKNCLVKKIEYQTKELIKDGGIFSCTKNSEQKLQIDFLLESIFAINYLAEKGNLKDAQRIINSISQCNTICEDNADYQNSCGCE